MNRLQKKCFLASLGLHALLAAVLLFGPAFMASRDKAADMPVLDFIPPTLVDAPFSNPGGNPKVTQPPAPAPLPQPQPPPPTPAPQPEKVVRPEAPAPKQPAQTPPDPGFSDKPAPGKRLPNVSTTPVVRKPDPRARSSDASSDAEADARAQARAAADARRRAVAGAIAGISGVASGSTSVEIPGPGGPAYANYAQVVKSVYTHAWIVPADVDVDDATTRASVTIARDGTVISARIIGPSGSAAVDASVRRTLEAVTDVAPFPAGAKEEQRTFTINFNLKAKRQLG